MPKPTPVGAAVLVAAPTLAIVGIAVSPTTSDDAAKQVAALAAHRSAVILGLTLETLALALLIAGSIWLALAIGDRAPRMALVGGILGVGGSLVVMFENGAAAATAAVVGALNPAGATAAVERIHSGALAGIEPLSLVGEIGLAILGYAAAKAGAPRWTRVAVPIGALCAGAGFATGTKPLQLIAFAILLVGLAGVSASLTREPAGLRPSDQVVVAAR